MDEPLDNVTDPSFEPASGTPARALIPRWLRIMGITAVATALAGSMIHLPYYSLGPGPATNVLSLIKVEGATTYPSAGKLLLTTASESNGTLNVWDMLWTWLDPNMRAVPREQLVEPGVSDEEQTAINFRDMEESKVSAEVAAFGALGLKATIIPGARILTVIPETAAAGKLERQDLIVAVDGTKVASPEAAVAGIQKHAIGDTVRITVRRGAATKVIPIVTRPALGDSTRPAVGVTLGRAWRLPHDIEIDTARIGGPSGGLVFALSIVDAFTPEDLTKGHVVAVTGTIELHDSQGVVGPIGAIQEKVRAARASGADVFIVPASEAADARAVAPSSLRIIGVQTLDQAIAALRALSPLRQ